ncbi:MAG: helix-turn-helix domain-containing protein [Bacteriovoracaceae bacterium]
MKNARNQKEIGQLIKLHRQKNNLTQAELAKACKVSQVFISKLESGLGGTITGLVKVMNALNLEVSFKEIKTIDINNIQKYLE